MDNATAAPESTSRHLRFVDGLRALAILKVLLAHSYEIGQLLPLTFTIAGLTLSLPPIAFLRSTAGAEAFFFISSFCLFYPYARTQFEGRPMQGIGEFFGRRVAKIVPSYYIALTFWAIFLPTDIAKQPVLAILHYPHKVLSHYVAHLLFYHNLIPAMFPSIVPTYWYLGVEAEFYLLFPFIARMFMRFPISTLFAMLFIATDYRFTIDSLHTQEYYYIDQLPEVIDIFGFGCMASYVIVRNRSKGLLGRYQILWTMLAVAALAAFSVLFFGSSHCSEFICSNNARYVLGPIFFCFTVGAAQGAAFLRKGLEHPVLMWLSRYSYNISLWHYNIFYFYQLTWGKTVAKLPGGALISLAVCLAVPLTIAPVITRLVEEPILRWSRSLWAARANRAAAEPSTVR